MSNSTFKSIVGKTFTDIRTINYNEEIHFTDTEGVVYRMWHSQDCCEHVTIEDVCGDFDDLIGTPILQADESSNDDPTAIESATYTFYRLATIKGSVTIRWYGYSNGYYSESVDFEITTK